MAAPLDRRVVAVLAIGVCAFVALSSWTRYRRARAEAGILASIERGMEQASVRQILGVPQQVHVPPFESVPADLRAGCLNVSVEILEFRRAGGLVLYVGLDSSGKVNCTSMLVSSRWEWNR